MVPGTVSLAVVAATACVAAVHTAHDATTAAASSFATAAIDGSLNAERHEPSDLCLHCVVRAARVRHRHNQLVRRARRRLVSCAETSEPIDDRRAPGADAFA